MAEKKQGIGIWNHYRTTDRADGLEFRGYVNGELVEARLYWAPADWSHPDGTKRAYVVVKVLRGKFDSFCGYEQELRWDGYVSDERSRRNWKELLSIAEEIGIEKLGEYVDNAIWFHEKMIEFGCTYQHSTYYYPNGKTQWVNEQMKKAWAARNAA